MRVPPRAANQLSIGVAIPIPQPYAQALTRARVEAGDPSALTIPPHITLLPPTSLDRAQVDTCRAHLRAVAAGHEPFIVELSGTDTFRPISPVVFVALAAGIAETTRLHESVNDGPLQQPMRFPFHPHVTIAHDLDEPCMDAAATARANFRARFPVSTFALYELGEDGVWYDLEVFHLKVVVGDA